MVFSCAPFVASIGGQTFTRNAQQAEISSKVEINIACTKALVCFGGSENRSCGWNPLTHCIDGNDTFCHLKQFFRTILWCYQIRKETRVEAEQEGMHCAFIRISVKILNTQGKGLATRNKEAVINSLSCQIHYVYVLMGPSEMSIVWEARSSVYDHSILFRQVSLKIIDLYTSLL